MQWSFKNGYQPMGRKPHYGIELELGGSFDKDKSAIAEELDSIHNDYFQWHNESCPDAMELISQPMGLREWYAFGARSLGCIIDEVKSKFKFDFWGAGLHIHSDAYSRSDGEKNFRTKLIILLSFYKDQIFPFLNRDMERLDKWATIPEWANVVNWIAGKEDLRGMNNSKGFCVVNNHPSDNVTTTELRIFGATDNLTYIMGSIELYHLFYTIAETNNIISVLTEYPQLSDLIRKYKYPDLENLVFSNMQSINKGIWEENRSLLTMVTKNIPSSGMKKILGVV